MYSSKTSEGERCLSAHPAMASSFQSRASEWNDLLCSQVSLFVDAELAYLETSYEWSRSHSIADIGCGNGDYLHKVSERFPNKLYMGADLSEPLIALAQTRHADSGIVFRIANIEARDIGLKFDAIFLRFVVQHLSDPGSFFGALRNCCSDHTVVYVIEPKLSASSVSPELPLLRQLLTSYDTECEKSGRSRALIGDVHRFSEQLGQQWSVKRTNLIKAAYHRPDMPMTQIENVMMGWINAVAAAGTISFDFSAARDEVSDWVHHSGSSIEFCLNIWMVVPAGRKQP
jgi:trans-aconitate methyltransferase